MVDPGISMWLVLCALIQASILGLRGEEVGWMTVVVELRCFTKVWSTSTEEFVGMVELV